MLPLAPWCNKVLRESFRNIHMALHKFIQVEVTPRESVLSWNDKYRPKCMKDIKCNANAAKKVYEWCVQVQGQKNQVLLVIGPHGCGKSVGTQLALQASGMFTIWKDNHEIRNKPFIEELEHISANENHNMAVVVDNIDMNAKGIVDFVKDIVKKKTKEKSKCKDIFPALVLISNNTYGTVNSILNDVDVVYFTAVSSIHMAEISKDILTKERRPWSPELIKPILSKSVGDLRYFLLQLEFVCSGKQKDSFFVTKRLEHVSIFNACEEILNSPALGVAKGCYLASTDTSMLPSLIFENYGMKFAPEQLSLVSGVSTLLSDIDIFQGSYSSELLEMTTYGSNVFCKKGKNVAKDLKYPSMFAKLHLEHSYDAFSCRLRDKTKSVTVVNIDPHMFADTIVRAVERNDVVTLQRIIDDYKLDFESINHALKMCNLRKVTLKAKAKTVLTHMCAPYEACR